MTDTTRLGARPGWHLAALVGELADRPVRADLAGRGVVLFRMPSGPLGALEDVCPHEGFPMSTGWVTDLGLRCGYHDYEFGVDGRCVRLRRGRGDCSRVAPATPIAVRAAGEFVLVAAAGNGASHDEPPRPDPLLARVSDLLAGLAPLGDARWGRRHCTTPDVPADQTHSHSGARGVGQLCAQEFPAWASTRPCLDSLADAAAPVADPRAGAAMVEVSGAKYPVYARSVLRLNLAEDCVAVLVTIPAVAGDAMVSVVVRTGPLREGADHSHLYLTYRIAAEPTHYARLAGALATTVAASGWTDLLAAAGAYAGRKGNTQ